MLIIARMAAFLHVNHTTKQTQAMELYNIKIIYMCVIHDVMMFKIHAIPMTSIAT